MRGRAGGLEGTGGASPVWTRFELLWPNWHRDRTCQPGAFQKDRLGASGIVHDGHPAWTHLELPVRLTRQARRNNIVITMRAVHVGIRRIGNSQGIVIPKPVLAQLGLDSKAGAEMTIEDGALVLRRPASPARTGWAEAARRIAEAGDDELVMGEFGNAEDSELVW